MGVYLAPSRPQNGEANARLIAAAPELLAALRQSLIIINANLCPFHKVLALDGKCDCNYHIAAQDVRAAIAKAEGHA